MININHDNLNPLEKKINDTLVLLSKEVETITISQAAEACDCSISKISKFAKKLGFVNFKQYVDFLYGRGFTLKKDSAELSRIKNFIDEFDEKLVEEFIKLLESHSKIILFGYGPSFICAQYFEYKLRITTNKVVIAVQDDISVDSLMDNNSLLVIFSATGKFKSFNKIDEMARNKGCDVLVIIEEYNPLMLSEYDKIFWLSKYKQPDDLKPYEKSRIVFFIFIEEVIRCIIENSRETNRELNQVSIS